MEYSCQALRHHLPDIRHRFCFVPSIQTGDKPDDELCPTYTSWVLSDCNGGLVVRGRKKFEVPTAALEHAEEERP